MYTTIHYKFKVGDLVRLQYTYMIKHVQLGVIVGFNQSTSYPYRVILDDGRQLNYVSNKKLVLISNQAAPEESNTNV